jgi:hypothetical protein
MISIRAFLNSGTTVYYLLREFARGEGGFQFRAGFAATAQVE